jgi:hypothetical protein
LTESDIATFIIAMLRVQGFPPTFAAFMTSIAVRFQSVTTSARATGGPATSVKAMIAECSVFIDGLLDCRNRRLDACGQLLRSELNRRSKVRRISLKEGPRHPPGCRATRQLHEDVG